MDGCWLEEVPVAFGVPTHCAAQDEVVTELLVHQQFMLIVSVTIHMGPFQMTGIHPRR